MSKPSLGERALEKAITELRERDTRFDDKIAYWNYLSDKFNTTGLSPMQLSKTLEGRTKLDVIKEKVSAAMIAKYGE
jgi:hypothetical protein